MRDLILSNYKTEHGLFYRLRCYLELCKFKIAAFSSLSAATGFVLANSKLDSLALTAFFGVLLLACGACALNQYQERMTDALMNRTKSRPVPSGYFTPSHALGLSLFLIFSGVALLFTQDSPLVPSLGIFAVLWYNGVYTYLKKKTAFAAIPGALTGAIPPAIGWIAGGGDIYSYKIAIICFFFFIWQVPHFWLLLLAYDTEYSSAGFPTLTKMLSVRQIKRITFVWITATAVSCLFLPVCLSSFNSVVLVLLVGTAAWLVWNGTNIFDKDKDNTFYISAFHTMNIFMFVIMILLNFDRLLLNLS